MSLPASNRIVVHEHSSISSLRSKFPRFSLNASPPVCNHRARASLADGRAGAVPMTSKPWLPWGLRQAMAPPAFAATTMRRTGITATWKIVAILCAGTAKLNEGAAVPLHQASDGFHHLGESSAHGFRCPATEAIARSEHCESCIGPLLWLKNLQVHHRLPPNLRASFWAGAKHFIAYKLLPHMFLRRTIGRPTHRPRWLARRSHNAAGRGTGRTPVQLR